MAHKHIPRDHLTQSAFGLPKTSIDKSLTHAAFTFDLPKSLVVTLEKINGQIFRYDDNDNAQFINSVGGELVLQTGPNIGDMGILHSLRHPRLEPNRGLIDSLSVMVDNWKASGYEVEVGFFNLDENTLEIQDGATVCYKEGNLYFRCYSLGIRHTNDLIDPEMLNKLDGGPVVNNEFTGFDAALGHLLDIQGEWRGVGDWFVYVSTPYDSDSQAVYNSGFLNRRRNLTISNPAMHAGYIARNMGQVPSCRSGCLDVSSEGGGDENQQKFIALNDLPVSVQPAGTAVLAYRVPFTYKEKRLTRDTQVYRVSVSSDKRAGYIAYRVPVSALRKLANQPLVDADWQDIGGGSAMQRIDNSGGLITSVDLTNATVIAADEVPANTTIRNTLPEPERIPQWVVHGQAVVIIGEGAQAAMKGNIDYGELI